MTHTIYRKGKEYSTEQYEIEKASGERNNQGTKRLKKLSQRHIEIIDLHTRGYKMVDIAKTVGVTRFNVSNVLNDPLAQDVIKKAHQQVENEFDALYGRVVDTIRDGLEKEIGLDTRLRAVDRYAKMKQVNGDQGKGPETAEDVVDRILQLNIQVNAGS